MTRPAVLIHPEHFHHPRRLVPCAEIITGFPSARAPQASGISCYLCFLVLVWAVLSHIDGISLNSSRLLCTPFFFLWLPLCTSFMPSSTLSPLSCVSPPSATGVPPTAGLLSPFTFVSASSSFSFPVCALQTKAALLEVSSASSSLTAHFPIWISSYSFLFSSPLSLITLSLPLLHDPKSLIFNRILLPLTNFSSYPLGSLNSIISKCATGSVLLFLLFRALEVAPAVLGSFFMSFF